MPGVLPLGLSPVTPDVTPKCENLIVEIIKRLQERHGEPWSDQLSGKPGSFCSGGGSTAPNQDVCAEIG